MLRPPPLVMKTRAQVIIRPVAKFPPAVHLGDPCGPPPLKSSPPRIDGTAGGAAADGSPTVAVADLVGCAAAVATADNSATVVVADSIDGNAAVVAKARPMPPSCPPVWSWEGRSSLVSEIKAWQRRGLAYSQCWYRFVIDQGSSTFDPSYHTSDTLSEFLSMVRGGQFELISAKAMPCRGEARAARILAAKGKGKLASDRSGRGKGRGQQNGTAEATSRPGAPPPKSTTPTRSCSRGRKRLSTPPRGLGRGGVRPQPPEPKSDPPTKSKDKYESDSDDWGPWTADGMADEWRD